jgi:hypothetical protein
LRRRNNTFQVTDNLSFNKGRHFMKVGFEVRRVRENIIRAQVTRGTFDFTNAQWTGIDGVANTGHTLANFIIGLTRQKARRISDFATRLRATEYGTYFQDDFKITQNLTLNIGLRYMLYLPPTDTRDRISTFISPARCPSFLACGASFTIDSPFVPYWGLAEGTAKQYNACAAPLKRLAMNYICWSLTTKRSVIARRSRRRSGASIRSSKRHQRPWLRCLIHSRARSYSSRLNQVARCTEFPCSGPVSLFDVL